MANWRLFHEYFQLIFAGSPTKPINNLTPTAQLFVILIHSLWVSLEGSDIANQLQEPGLAVSVQKSYVGSSSVKMASMQKVLVSMAANLAMILTVLMSSRQGRLLFFGFPLA
ncbi:hypothetical protein R6Q59_010231 [Mikania micrantha]